jgi:hypothetical protein
MKSRELLFLVLVAGAAGYLIATAPWLVVAGILFGLFVALFVTVFA